MITTTPFILKDSPTNPFIKIFFSNILNAFGEELNKLASVICQYPNNLLGLDDLERENDVFTLIEQTYVGILNTAIIRTYPNAVTLQEFGVYSEDLKRGRADLLITFEGDQSGTEFLIKAKHAGEANYQSYSNEKALRWYKKLYSQALQYYTAEQKYYLQQPTIVTITFEWARNQKQLKEVLEETTTDEYTDFYYLYHTNSAGLLVYGTYSDKNTAVI